MPRGNGTGPMGEGPRTGRALGYCAGNDRPGFAEPGVGFRGGGRFRAPRASAGRAGGIRRGRGLARTRGFGKGFAWRARAQFQEPEETAEKSEESEDMKSEKEEEKEALKEELESLKEDQKEIERRLKELK